MTFVLLGLFSCKNKLSAGDKVSAAPEQENPNHYDF
jgi:hypothetical protein